MMFARTAASRIRASRYVLAGSFVAGSVVASSEISRQNKQIPWIHSVSRTWTEASSSESSSDDYENGAAIRAAHARGPSPSGTNLIIPTMQATMRAMRLTTTAMLMATDYKFVDWGLTSVTHNDEHEEQRRKLENRVTKLRSKLHDAQAKYADEKNNDPDLHKRLHKKKTLRQNVQQAAQELADTEEQLHEIGSKKSLVHKKAAQRLLDMCRRNGGVYIKVGQHLANLDYLLPAEYLDTLSSLFDDTPRTDIHDVYAVLTQDLGITDVNDVFDQFDATPIASASLAQVHVAYDRDTGRKLAIKVQHRGLRETSRGDLFSLITVVKIAEKLFQDFNWAWLADEIAPHLLTELDFVNEGRNAERAARNLRAVPHLDCVIPGIVWKYSSPRVLTMEFEDGFKVTDLDAIQAAGLKKHDVARLVSSVFASQAFLSAWCHSDPHPANVLLRANRRGRPQMVLVDHGLYRELDNDFRIKYSKLSKSLMLADLDGIKQACSDLGVEKAYTLFAAMLTARPFDEIIERSQSGSISHIATSNAKHDQALISGYAQQFIGKIFDLLNDIPRQMLLLLKMNDCLRHIDHTLGSPMNTMVICGQYANRALYQDALQQHGKSWLDQLRAWWDYFRVAVRIQVHDLGMWWMQQTRSLL